MSEAEIHYLIPKKSRQFGDTESIINAIGAFQAEIPFPHDRAYEQIPDEVAGESVFIRLKKTTKSEVPRYELLEYTEKMRLGVEKHFSEQDRVRLSRHFAGITIKDALETE
ncbi:hypothetical protein H7100_00305 [Candidatus Saccharibacteria bacterium]|nr:hypothetical protein [Candidatus Saccharibacteria bacterium]